jgi:hypothetical protein
LGIIDLRFAMDDRHFSPKQDNMERNVVWTSTISTVKLNNQRVIAYCCLHKTIIKTFTFLLTEF